MSVNGYITRVANAAIVRDLESDSIKRSSDAIQTRIVEHFGEDVTFQRIFGSFERRTMLPRSMDPNSDVDLMVVFKDDGSKPQTYIERLRRFVHKRYHQSNIYRSHPTVVLELSHIRFELVPTISDWLNDYRIPAPRTNWSDWMEADPLTFSNNLTDKNRRNNGKVRPLIRIMKYWNVRAGRPFSSIELEELIVKQGYIPYMSSWLGNEWNLFRYFQEFVEGLTQWTIYESSSTTRAIESLQSQLQKIRDFEKHGDFLNAENTLKRLLALPA